MERNEEEGSLASFLPRDVSSPKSERFLPSVVKIDRIRWPTFANNSPRKLEWINSRKGIDLFISWCWIEFLSPSIKTFKMVETLVERIARCVNGALILTKRPRAQIFHLPWSLRAIMLFKSFLLLLVSLLSFLSFPPPSRINFTEQEISSRKRQCGVAVSRVARRIPNFFRDSR